MASGLDFSVPNITRATTLLEVKQAIENLKGFKIDQQILQLDNDQDLILSDEKSLQDYGLYNENASPTRAESLNVLKLVLHNKPIILHVNLGHSLLKSNQLA